MNQLKLLPVVYVPVDVKERLPRNGENVSVSFDEGKNFSYETTFKEIFKDELGFTHWLEPVENKYLLSREELKQIIDNYVLAGEYCDDYFNNLFK